jgi:hypothetical protein
MPNYLERIFAAGARTIPGTTRAMAVAPQIPAVISPSLLRLDQETSTEPPVGARYAPMPIDTSPMDIAGPESQPASEFLHPAKATAAPATQSTKADLRVAASTPQPVSWNALKGEHSLPSREPGHRRAPLSQAPKELETAMLPVTKPRAYGPPGLLPSWVRPRGAHRVPHPPRFHLRRKNKKVALQTLEKSLVEAPQRLRSKRRPVLLPG